MFERGECSYIVLIRTDIKLVELVDYNLSVGQGPPPRRPVRLEPLLTVSGPRVPAAPRKVLSCQGRCLLLVLSKVLPGEGNGKAEAKIRQSLASAPASGAGLSRPAAS